MTLDINWRLQPLGEVTDRELAEKLGCAVGTVRDHRLRRGIKFTRGRPSKFVDWDSQPLGKMPDHVVAEKLKIGPDRVTRERQKRKIPNYGYFKFGKDNPTSSKWDNEPLGEVPDKELALKHGVTRQRIEQIRKMRGIESLAVKARREQLARIDELGMLGKISDIAVAELANVTQAMVRAHRNSQGIPSTKMDWSGIPLGTKADGAMAKDLGMSFASVARARRRLGIPAFVGASGHKLGIDWDNQPLGEVPDMTLATRLGCSSISVRSARIHREIPLFKPSEND